LAEQGTAVEPARNKILAQTRFYRFSGRNGTIAAASAAGNDILYFGGKSGIFRKFAGSRDSFFRPHGLYWGGYLDEHHSNFSELTQAAFSSLR